MSCLLLYASCTIVVVAPLVMCNTAPFLDSVDEGQHCTTEDGDESCLFQTKSQLATKVHASASRIGDPDDIADTIASVVSDLFAQAHLTPPPTAAIAGAIGQAVTSGSKIANGSNPGASIASAATKIGQAVAAQISHSNDTKNGSIASAAIKIGQAVAAQVSHSHDIKNVAAVGSIVMGMGKKIAAEAQSKGGKQAAVTADIMKGVGQALAKQAQGQNLSVGNTSVADVANVVNDISQAIAQKGVGSGTVNGSIAKTVLGRVFGAVANITGGAHNISSLNISSYHAMNTSAIVDNIVNASMNYVKSGLSSLHVTTAVADAQNVAKAAANRVGNAAGNVGKKVSSAASAVTGAIDQVTNGIVSGGISGIFR